MQKIADALTPDDYAETSTNLKRESCCKGKSTNARIIYIALIGYTKIRPTELIGLASFICITGPLCVDKHLKVVREDTWEVRASWKRVGLQLGIVWTKLDVSTSCSLVCMYKNTNTKNGRS